MLLTIGVSVHYAGCDPKVVPLIQNVADAATEGDGGSLGDGGTCGSTTCQSGELCCPGADEACTPTCMRVSSCPALGRPCRAPDGGVGAALQWYEGCADPTCKPIVDGGEVDGGACSAAGTTCGAKGATCGDPSQNCGVILICDDHDPRAGGCPVSSKKYKQDVVYADEATLKRLHDETLATRLATYRYTGKFQNPLDPQAEHLGFIIEDQPQSFAVDRGHDRVDLYGMMSMSIATMQVQEREIAELKTAIRELRSTCRPPGEDDGKIARPTH